MAGKHRWQRKPVVLIIAAVIIVAGAVGAWATTHRSAEAATSTTATVKATVETLKQSVSATGTIEPKTQSDLSFASSGTVTSVAVAVGDTVTAGQRLATIDPTDLQTALTVAQAGLDSASAQLTSAQASGTTTQVSAAEAQVASATAKRDSAQQDLTAATMTSPIAGTVATVSISTGTRVSGGSSASGSSGGGSGSAGASGSGSGSGSASGSSGSSSTAQIVVISTNAWIVNASVSSADLAQVKKGLQVQVTPTGARAQVFGTVTSVGVIASTTSGTASFPVTVAVTGTPTGLYAGGTADVSIVTRQIADAITVPTAAIRSENGQTVVHQLKNGATVSTPVTLGLVSGATTQVTKGLSEGDEVVVETRTFPGGGATGGTGGTGNRTRGTGNGGFGGGGLQGGGGGGAVPGGGPVVQQGAPVGGGQ